MNFMLLSYILTNNILNTIKHVEKTIKKPNFILVDYDLIYINIELKYYTLVSLFSPYETLPLLVTSYILSFKKMFKGKLRFIAFIFYIKETKAYPLFLSILESKVFVIQFIYYRFLLYLS